MRVDQEIGRAGLRGGIEVARPQGRYGSLPDGLRSLVGEGDIGAGELDRSQMVPARDRPGGGAVAGGRLHPAVQANGAIALAQQGETGLRHLDVDRAYVADQQPARQHADAELARRGLNAAIGPGEHGALEVQFERRFVGAPVPPQGGVFDRKPGAVRLMRSEMADQAGNVDRSVRQPDRNAAGGDAEQPERDREDAGGPSRRRGGDAGAPLRPCGRKRRRGYLTVAFAHGQPDPAWTPRKSGRRRRMPAARNG